MDRRTLRPNDRIRLLHVPQADLDDRASQSEDPDWIPTADVLGHLITHHPVQIIDHIDDYGNPWFVASFIWNGEKQTHSIALMDNDSWTLADR